MELGTGAMGTLLPKLRELLTGEYKLEKSVREDLVLIQREMTSMSAALCKVEEVPRQELHRQVKIWADEVREVSYVFEDSIDRFMLSIGDASAGPDLRKKTFALLKKDKPRHRIGVDIKGIKVRMQEMSDRRDRNRVDEISSYPSRFINIDPRLMALYSHHSDLVGLEEPRQELIERLQPDWENYKRPLKTLSIVGFPGVGKTTLAKAVYEKIKVQFDCAAFVPVGRNPEMKKVLMDILCEVDRQKYRGGTTSAMDERQLMNLVRELLADMRYFIVIDDIWDTKSWEMIRWALVDNNVGSIAITTTRIYEVAARAGGVYKLEPLSLDNSERLLRMRLFDSEVKSTDEQTTQLIQKILQTCGGVPLAIITIASFLSGKQKEDWYKVSESIYSWAEDNIAVQEARMIILFSYYDLPNHLRICLVHLSIFPKKYMIRKDTLIWKWVAEGFIPENPRAGLFEMGEGFFNELINRNLIEPVEISHNGDIIGCRVHDMVVDIIRSIAKEKNFLALLNGDEQHASLEYARRLALQGEVIEGQQPLADTDMSPVRSFNAIKCHISMMPSLERFELLRVLAIEDCSSFQVKGNPCSLEHIGKLLLLRYLGLSKSHVSNLPEEVGNLKFLEILDVRQTGIRELSKSVRLLRRLKCLRADGGSTRVPDWIGNLTSLEELSLSDVSSCPNFVKEVGKLTMLRELKIWIRVLDGRSKNALVKSLSNLQRIQVLHLNGGLLIEEAEWEGYVPPRQLHRLSLRIKSLRLPRWINSSLLPTLSHLSVDLRVVEADDLATLGNFPGLISLELFIPNRVSLEIKGCDAFPKLRHCYSSGMLRFLEGAAPCLESAHFNVMSALGGASFQCGFLGKLPLLKEVRVEIFYSDVHVAAEVEKELCRAVDDHPNSPNLHVSQYEIVL